MVRERRDTIRSRANAQVGLVWFGLVWFWLWSSSAQGLAGSSKVRCGAVRCVLWLHWQRGNEAGWGSCSRSGYPGTQAEGPLPFGACAFSGLQALSGVQVRGGQKEMRFVIGLFPVARGHTFKCHRIPQEKGQRRRAFGGCSIPRYLSRQSRTRHKGTRPKSWKGTQSTGIVNWIGLVAGL